MREKWAERLDEFLGQSDDVVGYMLGVIEEAGGGIGKMR